MTVDFQVVYPQDIVQLTQIKELYGYDPRALYVEGVDFRRVEEVLINDQISPRFSVLSMNRLIAQVPDSELDHDIDEVTVLSARLTVTQESILKFRLSTGSGSGKVHGFMRLLQMYVKVLLTTPGTDIWMPGIGGGLQKKIGFSVSRGDEGQGLLSEAVICCDNTARQIVELQSRQKLPPEERLLSAKVVASKYDPELQMLTISPKIVSHAGVTGYATLVL